MLEVVESSGGTQVDEHDCERPLSGWAGGLRGLAVEGVASVHVLPLLFLDFERPHGEARRARELVPAASRFRSGSRRLRPGGGLRNAPTRPPPLGSQRRASRAGDNFRSTDSRHPAPVDSEHNLRTRPRPAARGASATNEERENGRRGEEEVEECRGSRCDPSRDSRSRRTRRPRSRRRPAGIPLYDPHRRGRPWRQPTRLARAGAWSAPAGNDSGAATWRTASPESVSSTIWLACATAAGSDAGWFCGG